MGREYTAWFTTSAQISQDQWDVYHPHMKLTDKTTIGEIREWYKKHFPGTAEQKEAMLMTEVTISQLSNPE